MPVLRKAASSISMGPANEYFKQKNYSKEPNEKGSVVTKEDIF
jgi:hypothetical protein